jgi:hypothetical protein
MMARVLRGADLPAAREGTRMLVHRIQAVEDTGRLAVEPAAAAQILWASANAAALLYVTAAFGATGMAPPAPATIACLRDGAIRDILKPDSKE